MPNYDEILDICSKKNLFLIEDAAESLGSTYKGIISGSFGTCSVHSFHRTKTLTTGEGGALLTDDYQLFERCKFLRDQELLFSTMVKIKIKDRKLRWLYQFY